MIHAIRKAPKVSNSIAISASERINCPKNGFPSNQIAAKLTQPKPYQIFRSRACEELKTLLGDMNSKTDQILHQIRNDQEEIITFRQPLERTQSLVNTCQAI